MAKDGEVLLQSVNTSMIEGIMFGTIYPDLTLEILKNEYENVDMNNWEEARKYGVSLPKNPTIKSVTEKENEVTQLFKDYLTEYHPALRKHNGKLFCIVCGFNFVVNYGEIGKDVIEIHHLKPMHLMDVEGEKSTVREALKRVATVCPNCHRIIHKAKPMLSIKKTRALLTK